MPLFQQLPKVSNTLSSRIYLKMNIEHGKLLNHMMCKLFIEEPVYWCKPRCKGKKGGKVAWKGSSCLNPNYTMHVMRPRLLGAPWKVPAAL